MYIFLYILPVKMSSYQFSGGFIPAGASRSLSFQFGFETVERIGHGGIWHAKHEIKLIGHPGVQKQKNTTPRFQSLWIAAATAATGAGASGTTAARPPATGAGPARTRSAGT